MHVNDSSKEGLQTPVFIVLFVALIEDEIIALLFIYVQAEIKRQQPCVA